MPVSRQPFGKPCRSPLEAHIAAQANAGIRSSFGVRSGPVPNPRFRYPPTGGQLSGINQFGKVISARSGHHRDICHFCVHIFNRLKPYCGYTNRGPLAFDPRL